MFPDVPVSKKPAEVRMGSGKGAPEFWVAKIKPGRILFEIDGVDLATAKEAMRLGAGQAFDRDEVRRPQRVRRTWPKKAKQSHGKAEVEGKGRSRHGEDVVARPTTSAPRRADELSDQLGKLKKEQFNLRFQRANGQLEKTSRIRVVAPGHRAHQTILTEQRRKAG